MSLITPIKVLDLQTVLHAKAKESPNFRFYALYDKIYRRDILEYAYECCLANKGAAGVDGQTFSDIQKYGEEKWLRELAEEIRTKNYRPEAVRRVYIPKANGKKRPLGIPTIKDRVVQMAVMIVIEPIFEADLQEEQHAYRPGRSALDAVQRVHSLLSTGYRDVVDADLSGYFDSIPHAELMKSVARRIVDRQMLSLIKSWLDASVEETDERGRKHRTSKNKDEKVGTPQGSPISPLLANLYMRRFILAWKKNDLNWRIKAHIVNYADDFVICCQGTADKAMILMRKCVDALKLTVNEEKTRICRIPEDEVTFLGYTLGRRYKFETGKPYIGSRPSKKSVQNILKTVSEQTSRKNLYLDADIMVKCLNSKLGGWANYFQLGSVSKIYRQVDAHTRRRLRWWLCRKHKHRGSGVSRYPVEFLYKELKLVQLQWIPRSLPWAKV